jgi:hypothetical protein
MRKSVSSACLLLLIASFPRPSWADNAPQAASSAAVSTSQPSARPIDPSERGLWDARPPTYRSGFTAGLTGVMAFGTVAGYPNDFSKVDHSAFRSATSGVGSGGMLYFGGTITDWFTFALGFSQASYGGSRNVARGWAFLFHIETFPLFSLGGIYRDLGLFADFGTGMATIHRRSDDVEYASSGALSIVGVGAFWETWRLAGHFAVGPLVSVHHQTSDAMKQTFGQAGLRAAFYGGP